MGCSRNDLGSGCSDNIKKKGKLEEQKPAVSSDLNLRCDSRHAEESQSRMECVCVHDVIGRIAREAKQLAR